MDIHCPVRAMFDDILYMHYFVTECVCVCNKIVYVSMCVSGFGLREEVCKCMCNVRFKC